MIGGDTTALYVPFAVVAMAGRGELGRLILSTSHSVLWPVLYRKLFKFGYLTLETQIQHGKKLLDDLALQRLKNISIVSFSGIFVDFSLHTSR